MQRSLRVQPTAEEDITRIFSWYEKRRAHLGEELLLALDHCFLRITQAPFSCSKVHHEVRRALLSRFPYCVYFIVVEAEVIVLAVLHGHRNPLLLQRLMY